MSYLILYLSLATTLSIYSVLQLIWPIIKAANAKNIKNAFTVHPYLSTFVAFIINLVIAPFWLVTMLFPKLELAAIMGLQSVILENDSNYTLD